MTIQLTIKSHNLLLQKRYSNNTAGKHRRFSCPTNLLSMTIRSMKEFLWLTLPSRNFSVFPSFKISNFLAKVMNKMDKLIWGYKIISLAFYSKCAPLTDFAILANFIYFFRRSLILWTQKLTPLPILYKIELTEVLFFSFKLFFKASKRITEKTSNWSFQKCYLTWLWLLIFNMRQQYNFTVIEAI